MRIAIKVQTFARFGQEVDDLLELDVQQGRELRPRHDQRVEIDCGSDEVSAEITRAMGRRLAFDQYP